MPRPRLIDFLHGSAAASTQSSANTRQYRPLDCLSATESPPHRVRPESQCTNFGCGGSESRWDALHDTVATPDKSFDTVFCRRLSSARPQPPTLLLQHCRSGAHAMPAIPSPRDIWSEDQRLATGFCARPGRYFIGMQARTAWEWAVRTAYTQTPLDPNSNEAMMIAYFDFFIPYSL